jgi:hypothetical protein
VKKEFIEGPKSRENFERTMTALFKATKAKKMTKPKQKLRKKGKD